MNLIFLQAETQTLGFSACALAVSITTTINKMLAYDFYTVLHVLTRAYTYRRGTYLCRCRVKVNTYKATRLSSTYSQMQSKYIFACKYIQSRPHIWAAELFPTRRIFTLPSNNWSTHTHADCCWTSPHPAHFCVWALGDCGLSPGRAKTEAKNPPGAFCWLSSSSSSPSSTEPQQQLNPQPCASSNPSPGQKPPAAHAHSWMWCQTRPLAPSCGSGPHQSPAAPSLRITRSPRRADRLLPGKSRPHPPVASSSSTSPSDLCQAFLCAFLFKSGRLKDTQLLMDTNTVPQGQTCNFF